MKEAVRAAAKKQFPLRRRHTGGLESRYRIELSASKVVVDEVTNQATELSIDEAPRAGW